MMASGEITANVLAEEAPTAIAASHRPIEEGRTPPPNWHRHRSSGSLLYVSTCLGLLLYCETSLCCRAPSASYAVEIKLQGQLLAQERELDSREGGIAMWEDGLAALECTLGKVCMEHDTNHVRAEAVQ
jgi:hypothetical protein